MPGPPGGPGISVLILRPAETQGPIPGMYFVHPGGMVMGDRWFLVEPLVPYVAEGNAVVVSVEYRRVPEHPDPARSRTATPDRCGRQTTRPNSASTRAG